jgi:molybdopterin-guanine dinucleotide biosynthesis protein B
LIAELEGAPEPDLAQIVAWFGPCDLVIVEGYKSVPIPKIEARRSAAFGTEPLADKDPSVIAIATDHAVDGHGRPVFALDDVAGIADFVAGSIGLAAKSPAKS